MDGINKNFKLHRKPKQSTSEVAKAILNGKIDALSKGITLIESKLPSDRAEAETLIEKCLPKSGNSIRIGITGVPGVGKSTFIESFGNYLTEQGKRVAVLAIDPSSNRSGGSILGDKTRMETLVNNPSAYVRPTPSKGSLGGVARKTRESIILCEAAGFDVIIIETVGVGQSEIAVHGMVDFFLLLMLAGAGDELQGIKRGIMEMADAIAITKADTGNESKAKRARAEYANAIHLFPPNDNQWIPKVETCSALENKNIDKVWSIIHSFENHTKTNGSFDQKRHEQAEYWMLETINDELQQHFYENDKIKSLLTQRKKAVKTGEISPFKAAEDLIAIYLKIKE